MKANDEVYGSVNWERVERLMWDDTNATKLTIEAVNAESSTLWIARFEGHHGQTATGADWDLERAVKDAVDAATTWDKP
jgi:hypothetical protein